MATASSQLNESGLSASAPLSGRQAYSACPPPAMPVEATIRSPLLNLFTSLPRLSTSLANSVPRTRAFQGFPMPNMSLAIGRMDLVTNVKLRTLQSPVDTVVACMAIRTRCPWERVCPPPLTEVDREGRIGCAEWLSRVFPLGLLSTTAARDAQVWMAPRRAPRHQGRVGTRLARCVPCERDESHATKPASPTSNARQNAGHHLGTPGFVTMLA